MSEVSIYLNFRDNTEEVFTFYQSVFGGEFIGGIKRFGDIPQSDNIPPMSNELKNKVMHIELPILGGFKLMGTDAPDEFGFKINQGNNVYINLEPDTREETKKIFDALANGGVIVQELQEMFWGSYYGSCVDKYGIQWMFNCDAKSI